MKGLDGSVIAAPVLPLDPDGTAVDEAALRAEVRRLIEIVGIDGLVFNAVASEGSMLEPAEASEIIRLVAKEVGGSVDVLSGMREESTEAGRRRVEELGEAGAHAVLVQAPADFARGGSRLPDVSVRYFEGLASVGVPLIIFQHQLSSRRAYSPELLVELLGIDNVIGVKETSWDAWSYEQDVRAIRQARPEAKIFCGNDTQLLPCIATVPPDGLILGLAALWPEAVVGLWQALQDEDLAAARAANDRLAPLVRWVYQEPAVKYYPRSKAALVALGRIPRDRMRSPMSSLSDPEREELHEVLAACGLTKRSDSTWK